ncbi:hypothetical protein PARC_b0010 [Pseudoalteromonas arctica A 37-1-2]|uniref:Uncharacterized protein n=1 Tax=Pseudoalteromonas arctica A 37-1-2 TaxID=1117313 RepID=A0A290S873_9GAMM|nr:hypothetical protein PARC_b0010 [Pseudoalteromonas arctica A 37-1-2]
MLIGLIKNHVYRYLLPLRFCQNDLNTPQLCFYKLKNIKHIAIY